VRGRARRSWATLVAVAVVAAAFASVSAVGRSEGRQVERPRAALRPAPGAAVQEVTLITGDRVRLAPAGGGRRTVTVIPANGRATPYRVTHRGDDTSVIPADVEALVPRRLDPALFDVTALIRDGYGEESALPLIVAARPGAAEAPPGTTAVRRLESIDALAVRAPAADAGQLGRALERFATATLRGARAPAAFDGVEKIWLDSRVRPDLTESVPQIGAPEVWQGGHDGTGVTVAVLDTGIDAEHPSLAGSVAESRSFTGEPDAGDRSGHGTHVASTIAGDAPDMRGVAPGATLLNGKVLGDTGFGQASWIIDGMEWAAAEQQADVVNMSLGGRSAGAGDLMVEALDRLSADHGTLFVVAAGNDGCDECVGSPGIADRALTVGAVDDDDALAPFSSRGPVEDPFAVKPDATAPGVGIVAARARGSELGDPVDDLRTSMSGTSMATPHVAGAAALLLHSRPDMSGEAIKAALTSTATAAQGVSVFAQGAGRIDAARAVRAGVVVEGGSLSFGHFAYPHTGRPLVRRTVTYRNRGAAPIELELEASALDEDGNAPADGVLALPSQVTVPAGGTADVEVALDPTRAAAGLYAGVLLARSAAGDLLRTSLAFHIEPQLFELRVRGIARDGRAAAGGFAVLNVEDGRLAQRFFRGADGPCTSEPSGTVPCVRVPRGTYSVTGTVFTVPPDKPSTEWQYVSRNVSIVGRPEVEITHDTEIVLDARKAEEVEVETPAHETRANLGAAHEITLYRAPEHGPAYTDSNVLPPGTVAEEKFFLQPAPRVRHGQLAAITRWRLDAPTIRFQSLGRQGRMLEPEYYNPVWHSDNSWQYPRFDGRRTLRVVDAGAGTAEETQRRDLEGALALVRRSDHISVPRQSANAGAAGAVMIAVANDRPGSDLDAGEVHVALTIPTVRLSGEEGTELRRRLAAGHAFVRATGIVASPYRYDLVLAEDGRIAADQRHVVRPRDLARLDMRYHAAAGAETTFSEASYPFQSWQDASMTMELPVLGGAREREMYVTAQPGSRWAHSLTTPERPSGMIWPRPPAEDVTLRKPSVVRRPGERSTIDWFRQPLAPGLDPELPLLRERDLMRIAMAAFVDQAGHAGLAVTSPFPHGYTTDFRMYEDDRLLAQTDLIANGVLDVAPGPARYRIEYDVVNDTPWARLSTHSHGTWTFASARPPSGVIATPPLLTIGLDADVDLRNALRDDRLVIRVAHQPGAPAVPLRAPALDASYDDGTRWTPVRKLRALGGGRWRAKLPRAPNGARAVSLRVRAEDRAGNAATQQIVRAYALRR